MPQGLRMHAAIPEGTGSVSRTHIKQLATACNSSFRKSDVPGPPQVPAHVVPEN